MLVRRSREGSETDREIEAETAPIESASAQDHTPVTVPAIDHVVIFRQLIEGLPEQAALFDADTGTILAVNEAWEETVTLNGFSDFRPGNNYFEEIARVAAIGSEPAQAVLEAVDEMRDGKRTSFRLVYDGGGRQAGQKFEARLALLKIGEHRYVRITRYDITELALLRTMREGFSVSLSQAQEQERRRMGREMHDSGMQLLGAISLSLARLKLMGSDDRVAAIAIDLEGLLFEAQREFRSISFLAHPPQVERLGLEEAMRELVEGFGNRADINTRLTVDGDLGDLSIEAAHTVFRVAQEALSNVHRHAHAKTMAVRLVGRRRALHLVVADDGRGISADLRHGVGLLGMRARMKELGGRLTVRNGSPGTVIHACLPIPEREPAEPA